jgi:hypothetical protein
MTIRRAIAAFGLLVGVALVSRAQDPAPPASTPADPTFAAASAVVRGASTANVVPGSFRALMVVDNRFPLKIKPEKGPILDEHRDPKDRTGKIHCLVCEHGLSPVIAVFVRGDINPEKAGLKNLIKGADTLVPKYRSDKMAAFVIFLKLEGGTKEVRVKKPDGTEEPDPVKAPKEFPDTDLEKREKYVGEITDFAKACNTDNVPFGLAPTTSPSVSKFGIGETFELTDKSSMALKDATVPDAVVTKLAPLMNKRFFREEFARELGKLLTPEELKEHQDTILERTRQTLPITVIIYNRMRMAQRWELKTDELTDEKVAEILKAAEEMVANAKK